VRNTAASTLPVPPSAGTAAEDGKGARQPAAEPAPDLGRLTTALAQRDGDSDGKVSQAAANSVTAEPAKPLRPAPGERNRLAAIESQLAGAERHGDAPKPAGPRGTSGDRRDARTFEATGANTADVRLQPAMKRPPPSRPEAGVEAVLAHSGVPRCPGSSGCASDMPPLFGLGF
jgi:hypothetical protein